MYNVCDPIDVIAGGGEQDSNVWPKANIHAVR